MPEPFRRPATPQTAAATTMNLFPVAEKPVLGFGSIVSKQEVPAKSEPEAAQMTIFYGGQVIVFNDFPAEKAKEIMLLASKGNPPIPNNLTQKPVDQPSNLIPSSPNVVPNFSNSIIQERAQRPPQPIVSGNYPIKLCMI